MNKKIVLIVVTVLIVVALIITILYFTTDLFKSNQDLFWKYIAQGSDVLEIISNDKGALQKNFKQNNSYIGTGNLSLIKEQGEDSSKQLNMETNSRHDVTSGRTYADAILKNGELDLFKISYINSGDIYAIKCDEVFPNYIGIQNSGLKDLASNYQIPNTENIPDSIDFSQYFSILEMTEEQEKHLSDTYIPIIMNNISKEQYIKSKEAITIDYNSNVYNYDANAYRVSITGAEFKNILIDCLNAVKSDTETLTIISNKLTALGLGVEYTDTANLSSKIEELITKLQGMSMENNLDITVYEHSGELVRVSIHIGSKFNITYDKVNNSKILTINIENSQNMPNANDNSTEESNNQESNQNEIIDLNQVNNESTGSAITRIIVSNDVEENYTVSEIKIIPDTSNLEQNMTLTVNMSNIQNDSISNIYTLVINSFIDDKKDVLTISYENNINKTDQVEEIEELSSSNTAIANYYNPEVFNNFLNNWSNILMERLTQKLAILGFDEF